MVLGAVDTAQAASRCLYFYGVPRIGVLGPQGIGPLGGASHQGRPRRRSMNKVSQSALDNWGAVVAEFERIAATADSGFSTETLAQARQFN